LTDIISLRFNSLKLLSKQHLLQIESHLPATLDRVLDAPGLGKFKEMIRSYVLSGGKRIRPQLAVWTYLQCVLKSDRGNLPRAISSSLPQALLDMGAGWELFHAFLLVHDDIIDSADTRRERPSLHKQLASLDSNCPRFGVNMGIVAGDLLFSAALRLWHEIDVEPDAYKQLLRLFSRVACTTGFGQAIDICQSHLPLDLVEEETLLLEYHWKTAAYTFEGPMLSGAILAGLNEGARQAISKFALSIGQAYQLQNDLIDLSTQCTEGSDLVQGKRTITLIRHRKTLGPTARRLLDSRLTLIGQRTSDGRLEPDLLESAESLRRELLDAGVTIPTQALIDHLLLDARRAISDISLPAELSTGLTELLGGLQSQYFTPVEVASII